MKDDRIDRKPHAILDRSSRTLKAQKIEKILSRHMNLNGARLLDIGAGSGYIAEHFLDVVGPSGKVTAVDRVNQLKSDTISFHVVDSTTLPFDNDSFDIVLSNHVIEHVGEREVQLSHLRETMRVLDTNGILYLAVPNRWSPVEPHFKLPFLSWIPAALRSPYVRLFRRGDSYDCLLLSRKDTISLCNEIGFFWREVTMEALRIILQNEIRNPIGKLISSLPDFILRMTMPIIPTLVFLGRKRRK